jgi:hypothetical protein
MDHNHRRPGPMPPIPVSALPGAPAVVLALDRPEMLAGAYTPHKFIPGSLLEIGSFRADPAAGPAAARGPASASWWRGPRPAPCRMASHNPARSSPVTGDAHARPAAGEGSGWWITGDRLGQSPSVNATLKFTGPVPLLTRSALGMLGMRVVTAKAPSASGAGFPRVVPGREVLPVGHLVKQDA